MATVPPAVTPLPDPPSTSDPSNFDVRADAFLGALPDFQDEMDDLADNVYANAVLAEAAAVSATASAATATTQAALATTNGAAQVALATTQANNAAASAATAINAPGTSATSASPLTISTGAKSFTLAQTGKAFAVGQWVSIADTAAPATNWMLGAVTAFNAGTGAMTVDVQSKQGVITGSSWVIAASAPTVPSGTTTSIGSTIILNQLYGVFQT